MTTTSLPGGPSADNASMSALNAIQERVLWLAVRMVDEANRHAQPGEAKVGGHQASSASSVSILTALYFHWLQDGDRVCIKPHASPVFHAIQYLLGNLGSEYLKTLRKFGGLQAYPSRTKDPDPVDFSSGSEGLGPVAALFSALADRYVEQHFGSAGSARRRYVALIGDAELDEGVIWEAIGDPLAQNTDLSNVLWIVDLNRQSLDRVIPGIRVQHLQQQFVANGWRVLEAKYGSQLEAAFAQEGGETLRQLLDEMSNEEYQALLRMEGGAVRKALLSHAPAQHLQTLERLLKPVPNQDLQRLVSDLGGHDLAVLLDRLNTVDLAATAPTVIFAYTIKGWRLPFAGDPLNHSALLTARQLAALQDELGIAPDNEWALFPTGTPEQRVCQAAANRLYPRKATHLRNVVLKAPADFPTAPLAAASRSLSSQEAFGRALLALSRLDTPLVKRIVTLSPDVSISTNLAGWINHAGVWAERASAKELPVSPLFRWAPRPGGQHVELGISEMNLFMALSQFGLSLELSEQVLFPIGTLYDCFVPRGLDALGYAAYSGSHFLFAGTPSGVSLSHEGGAHQSTVTVSIGTELPNVHLYEPCFQLETEWFILEGLRSCFDRRTGGITYLRLSTKPIDQSLFAPARARYGDEALQAHVIRGGYRLFDAYEDGGMDRRAAPVIIASVGALIPEAVSAAKRLCEGGVAASVLNITSLDRLYAGFRQSRLEAIELSQPSPEACHLEALFRPEEYEAPIVTVLDGASHAMAFLGAARGQQVIPLGVDVFGQSGGQDEVYEYCGISEGHIVNACLLGIRTARTRVSGSMQ